MSEANDDDADHDVAPSTSEQSLDTASGHDVTTPPPASMRDVTSVDIDQLDCDSIDQLQLLLRRLQRRCDHDDDDDHRDDDVDENDDDVTAQQQQQTSGQLQSPVSCEV